MDDKYSIFVSLSFFLLLLDRLVFCATACDRCVHQSKAAHLISSSKSTTVVSGACGYGSMAFALDGVYAAAAGPSIYRDGVACGACFQIRCKNTRVCSSGGVKVVLTDKNKGSNSTDLVLTSPGFMAMARDGMDKDLKKLAIVDVEYKRIPCVYEKKNLSIRVEENSKRPSYLAIKFLFQGGQTDIVAVDVAQVGSPNWRYMTRDYGPVWSTSLVPEGPLQFRMVVTGGYDGRWVWADKEVLPAEWKVGSVYDMGVQISDIAQEGCSQCDSGEWKS